MWKYGTSPVVSVRLERFWTRRTFAVRRLFSVLFEWRRLSLPLETALSINRTCLMGSNQCDSTKNLFCNSSRCQCDFSTKYWSTNFQTCCKISSWLYCIASLSRLSVPRLNYTEMCVYDSDCLPTLVCPQVPGVCNCSQFLPDLVCNCDNTKYFNPLTTQCGTKLLVVVLRRSMPSLFQSVEHRSVGLVQFPPTIPV